MTDGNRFLALLATALLTVGLTACGGSNGGSNVTLPRVQNLDLANMVSLDEAFLFAAMELGDEAGPVVGVELELADDEAEPPAYDVTFLAADGSQLIEVEVDAMDGKIVEIERGDDEVDPCEEDLLLADAQTFDFDTALGLFEARDAAVAQEPGTALIVVLEIETDENEPPSWEVVVYGQDGSTLTEVEVDAFSGQVLETEPYEGEDECADTDEDDEGQ